VEKAEETPKKPEIEGNEKAARQQGGFLFRENSSNGGKAIRTFWRHSMGGQKGCQGKIPGKLKVYLSTT
jgi:hypothetical protein